MITDPVSDKNPDNNSISYLNQPADIQATLELSETNYKLLFKLNPVPMWMVAADTQDFIEVNDAASAMYGYSKEEFSMLNLKDLRPVEDIPSYYKVITQFKSENNFRGTVRHQNKAGEILYVRITTNTVIYNDKKVWLIAGENITDEVLAEKQLKESQQQLSLIFDNTNDGIWLIDIEGEDKYRMQTCNKAYTTITGLQKKDIVGKLIEELIPAEHFKKIKPRYKEVEQTGEAINFYLTTELPAGRLDGELRLIPIKNEHGSVVQILGTGRNLTEQQKTQQELIKANAVRQQSDERYKQIVETAHEGIWVIDENNKTVFVNNRMCEILGYTSEEMIGRTTMSFKDEEGRKKILNNLEQGMRGIKETHDATFISKSGKKIWTYLSSSPMLDKDGNYKGALAMVTDVTDKIILQQKLLDEQISNQHEILRAVVDAQERERAGIGAELHDNVNQLLATSRMYINICMSRKVDPKESLIKSEQYISQAIEEVRKLSHALVGPTQDKMMGLIPSVEDFIRDVSNAKNIKINFYHSTFREERNEVGLKLIIYRIIQEQINNILKHAEATEINIELKKQGKDLVVNIDDNGKGFDTSIPKKGIGLKNIANRAKLYDGTMQLLSFPGNGCKMKIIFKNHGIGLNSLIV